MKEALSNIGTVCPEHAPRPRGEFADLDPTALIGKFVKKAFMTDHHAMKTEHMWVEVKEVVDGKLRGKLSNDPVFCSQLKDGDTVDVAMNEIEDLA